MKKMKREKKKPDILCVDFFKCHWTFVTSPRTKTNKQTMAMTTTKATHTHKALAVSKYSSVTECSKVLPKKLKRPQTT